MEDLILPLLTKGYHWYKSLTIGAQAQTLLYLRFQNVKQSGKIGNDFQEQLLRKSFATGGSQLLEDLMPDGKFKDTREVCILTSIYSERMQNVRNKRKPGQLTAKAKGHCGLQSARGWLPETA